MKYIIKTRKLTERDLGRDCPFPVIEQEKYEEQLNLLADDFSVVNGVNDASVVGNCIHIDSVLSESELLDSFKHLFRRDFCIVRYQHIELLD
ncbi:hypothetical protein [Vibrio parahaemolyticus]|uniref:hypothetical protein n=1 Tax=Vibrio parahaemolyticus TaxID=670 RepID=UPI0011220B2F|nr:hypothetical protein [Vibrio parahaemolyticus]TOK06029.1 hypothetical protein CGI26_12165 [Vibrio parahaemolyticus]